MQQQTWAASSCGCALVAAKHILAGAAVAGAVLVQRCHVRRQALVDVQAHLLSTDVAIKTCKIRRGAGVVPADAVGRMARSLPADVDLAAKRLQCRRVHEKSLYSRQTTSAWARPPHLCLVLGIEVRDEAGAAGAHIACKGVLAHRLAVLPAQRKEQPFGTACRPF